MDRMRVPYYSHPRVSVIHKNINLNLNLNLKFNLYIIKI